MITFGRILAPSDFSPHSHEALRYACGLAERFGAELHVVHVLSEIIPAGPDPLLMPVMPPEFYAEDERRAAEVLRTEVKPEWGRPARVITAVRWGAPTCCGFGRSGSGVDVADGHALGHHGRWPQPAPQSPRRGPSRTGRSACCCADSGRRCRPCGSS